MFRKKRQHERRSALSQIIWGVAALVVVVCCGSGLYDGVKGGLKAVSASRAQKASTRSQSDLHSSRISYALESDRASTAQREVEVVLNQRASRQRMEQISKEIYSMVKPQRTLISYRLAAIEYAPAQRPWARASFNPSLELEIIGLSDKQAHALSMIKPAATREVIGVWLDDEAHRKIHVYRERDDYALEIYDVRGVKRVSKATLTEDERGRRLDDDQDLAHYLLITAFDYKLEVHRRAPDELVRRAARLSHP